MTSLFSGLSRAASCTIGLSHPIRPRMRVANSPILKVSPVPRLIVSPRMPGMVAARMNPSTVSAT